MADRSNLRACNNFLAALLKWDTSISYNQKFKDTEKQSFLANLTPYAIEARYGDYKKRLSEIINRNEAIKIMEKTEEMSKWLRKKITLMK